MAFNFCFLSHLILRFWLFHRYVLHFRLPFCIFFFINPLLYELFLYSKFLLPKIDSNFLQDLNYMIFTVFSAYYFDFFIPTLWNVCNFVCCSFFNLYIIIFWSIITDLIFKKSKFLTGFFILELKKDRFSSGVIYS